MDNERQTATSTRFLYAIDNVLTIKITMPPGDWDAVRTEQPAGGVCNFDWTGGSRYTWRKATSVEISGTHFPARTTFTDVGVKKKSFCGSINSDKPCLHIDFGKFSDANAPAAEALIGSRYLTLNNSVQDRSYIRQPLGYTLLGMAGLPHSRCNFARVLVNGKLIGQGVAGVNSPGVYVNAEPIMKRYIERNFNGNMNGNLYELEHHDDFVSGTAAVHRRGIAVQVRRQGRPEVRRRPHRRARAGRREPGAGSRPVHQDLRDGVPPQALGRLLRQHQQHLHLQRRRLPSRHPGVGNVKFKMIPWGIDQILQPQRSFKMGTDGLIAKLVRNDAARRTQLIDQIRTYRDTIFGREVQQTTLKPLIDRMEALLVGSRRARCRTREIATVRQQLRLAASAGYLCAGLPDTQRGLRPQGRHERVPARQQYRGDSGRAHRTR